MTILAKSRRPGARSGLPRAVTGLCRRAALVRPRLPGAPDGINRTGGADVHPVHRSVHGTVPNPVPDAQSPRSRRDVTRRMHSRPSPVTNALGRDTFGTEWVAQPRRLDGVKLGWYTDAAQYTVKCALHFAERPVMNALGHETGSVCARHCARLGDLAACTINTHATIFTDHALILTTIRRHFTVNG